MDKFFSRISLKKIFFVGIILFFLIQLYRPNKNNFGYIPANDFLVALKAPDTIKKLFINSCYDCHSNHTNYEWFDNIAPVSWWVDNTIKKGKTSLNFSDWSTFETWRKRSYLNATVFDIETDKMPTKAYIKIQPEAKLSIDDKALIINWIDNINRLDISEENEVHY